MEARGSAEGSMKVSIAEEGKEGKFWGKCRGRHPGDLDGCSQSVWFQTTIVDKLFLAVGNNVIIFP